MRVGAIIFDSSAGILHKKGKLLSLSDAWAAIAGSEPRRIKSIHELPSDVLWLSNLTYYDAYRVGISKHANFKLSNFLQLELKQILGELGILHLPESEQVRVVSMLAQRVMEVCAARYNVTEYKSLRLSHDFSSAFNAPKSSLPDKYYDLIEPIAKHSFVSSVYNKKYYSGDNQFNVRRNRLIHAKELMNTPIPPDNGWRLVRKSASKPENWLEMETRPFLARVTLHNVQSDCADLLAWGSGSNQVRDWITDIEFREINQFADIEVHSVLVCDNEAKPLAARRLLPNGRREPCAELSYTHGLVAQIVWTAFCCNQAHKSGAKRYSVAAAWLRSADRMKMFYFARKLNENGVIVSHYGAGTIGVLYPEGGLKKAISAITDVGMLPPANIFKMASDID